MLVLTILLMPIDLQVYNGVVTILLIFGCCKVSLSNNQVITELSRLNKTVLLSDEITGEQLELKMKTLMVSIGCLYMMLQVLFSTF